MLEQSERVSERAWSRVGNLSKYSGDLTLIPKDLGYFSAYLGPKHLPSPQTPGASATPTLTSAGASEPSSLEAAQRKSLSIAQDFAPASSCEPYPVGDEAPHLGLPEDHEPTANSAETDSSAAAEPATQAAAPTTNWNRGWRNSSIAAKFSMFPPGPNHDVGVGVGIQSRDSAASTASTSAAAVATASGPATTTAAAFFPATTSAPAADVLGTTHLSQDNAYQRFASTRKASGSTFSSRELLELPTGDVMLPEYELLPGPPLSRPPQQSRDSGYSLSPHETLSPSRPLLSSNGDTTTSSKISSPWAAATAASPSMLNQFSDRDLTKLREFALPSENGDDAYPRFDRFGQCSDDFKVGACGADPRSDYALFGPERNFGAIGSERRRPLTVHPPAAKGEGGSSSILESFAYGSTLNSDLNLPDEGFFNLSNSSSNLDTPNTAGLDPVQASFMRQASANADPVPSPLRAPMSTQDCRGGGGGGGGLFNMSKGWESASDASYPAPEGALRDPTRGRYGSVNSSAFQHLEPSAGPGGRVPTDQTAGAFYGRERSGSTGNPGLPPPAAAAGAASEKNGSFAGGYSNPGHNPSMPISSSSSSVAANSTWTFPPLNGAAAGGRLPSVNLESLSPGPYFANASPASAAASRNPPVAPGAAAWVAPRAAFPPGPFFPNAAARAWVPAPMARRNGTSDMAEVVRQVTVPMRFLPYLPQMPVVPQQAAHFGVYPQARFSNPLPPAAGGILPPCNPSGVPLVFLNPLNACTASAAELPLRQPTYLELSGHVSCPSSDLPRAMFGRGSRDLARANFFRRSSCGELSGLAAADSSSHRINHKISVRKDVKFDFTFKLRGLESDLAARFRVVPVQWQLHMVGLCEVVCFKIYAIADSKLEQRQQEQEQQQQEVLGVMGGVSASSPANTTSNSFSEFSSNDTDMNNNIKILGSSLHHASSGVEDLETLPGAVSEDVTINGNGNLDGNEIQADFQQQNDQNLGGQAASSSGVPTLQDLYRAGRLKVVIVTPTGRVFEPSVNTNSRTQVFFKYSFENFGKYKVQVTIDGDHIKGSEWALYCQEAKDYSNLQREAMYQQVLRLDDLPSDIKLHGVTFDPNRGLLLPDRSHAHVHRFDVEDPTRDPVYCGRVVEGDPEGLIPHTVMQPSDLGVSPEGTLFVCDKKGGKVQIYDKDNKPLASYIGLQTSWGVACSADNKMAVATFLRNDGELHVLDCDSETRNIVQMASNNPRKPFYLPDGRLALLDFEKSRILLVNDTDTTGFPLTKVFEIGDKGKPVGATIDAFGNVIVSTGRTCRLEFFRSVPGERGREFWDNFLSLDFKPRLPTGTSFGGVAVIPGGRLVVVLESYQHEVRHGLLLLNPPAERKHKR